MKMTKKIGSATNPLVKAVLQLDKSRERKEKSLFVVEGMREMLMALKHGYQVESLLYNEDELDGDIIKRQFEPYEQQIGEMVAANKAVFEKIAYRENGAGVVGILHARTTALGMLTLKDQPLILVLESVEKPGNLGAILRTADAAGVDAVILTDPATDTYNPNVIRSSLGCVFTLPVVTCQTHEAIAWLKDNGIGIYAAALQTDVLYYDVNMQNPAALVFGAEDAGLGQAWRDAAKQIIKIPMSGRIDSLNVSASVAILAFEAIRQRRG